MILRNLVLVLGDQLDLDAAAFDGFDAAHDALAQTLQYGYAHHSSA